MLLHTFLLVFVVSTGLSAPEKQASPDHLRCPADPARECDPVRQTKELFAADPSEEQTALPCLPGALSPAPPLPEKEKEGGIWKATDRPRCLIKGDPRAPALGQACGKTSKAT